MPATPQAQPPVPAIKTITIEVSVFEAAVIWHLRQPQFKYGLHTIEMTDGIPRRFIGNASIMLTSADALKLLKKPHGQQQPG